ncbi:MAG: S8 family serine peptidase, partial [Rubrivivax sp.]
GRVLGPRTQALRAGGIGSADLAGQLAAQPDVEWAVVDHRRRATAGVPNDPLFQNNLTTTTPTVGQWYLRAPDGAAVSAINALGAWSTNTGSSSVVVAVVDTGVRFDHPDLVAKLLPGYDFVSSTDDTPGDRDADASDPGDWTAASSSCGAGDSSWHGTQVSGLIAAATDNGIGMAGTARDVMLLPVRVLGKCGGYDSDIIAGMRWAGGIASVPTTNPHPAKVINMSLGSTGVCEQAYIDAIADLNTAKVTVVVAAGNENGTAVGTPANCPGAIAVGGLRHVGTKVGYSNLGPQVAISAPAGNCVNDSGLCLYPLLTTINLGSTTPSSNGYSDGVNYSVGTSFSAPLVSGAVALLLSVDPSLTPAQMRTALTSAATAFPTQPAGSTVPVCRAPNSIEQIECYCTTSTCGAGMLNVAAAIAALTPTNGLPPIGAIATSTSTPTPGQAVVLSGSGSTAIAGRSIVGYAWSVVPGYGTGAASFVGANSGSSVTLNPTAAGTVLVQLTVTDSAGASNSKTRLLTISGATSGGGSAGDPADSGGGGGAM